LDRRRAELGLREGKRFQRISEKRFKDIPNDESDRKAVFNRVMHPEQNCCLMRFVKRYGSYEEGVLFRERNGQFRLHFVFPALRRICRNYLKWNAQLGQEAKIRGTAFVRVDADSQ
jgi:hypothetical protein